MVRGRLHAELPVLQRQRRGDVDRFHGADGGQDVELHRPRPRRHLLPDASVTVHDLVRRPRDRRQPDRLPVEIALLASTQSSVTRDDRCSVCHEAHQNRSQSIQPAEIRIVLRRIRRRRFVVGEAQRGGVRARTDKESVNMKTWKMGMLSLVCLTAACNGQGGDDEAITQRIGALGGTARFNFVKTSDWGTGYNARVDVTNTGSTPIQGWSTEFDMPKNVQANVANLPQCAGSVQDNCWFIFSDIGPENIVRIFHTGSPNVINPGETKSEFLYGSYEAAFGFPTRCAAPLTSQSAPCNGSNDVTAPTVASNLSIFGTGSTLVDLFWR